MAEKLFASYEMGGQSGPDRSRAQLVGAAKSPSTGRTALEVWGSGKGRPGGLLPPTKPEFPTDLARMTPCPHECAAAPLKKHTDYLFKNLRLKSGQNSLRMFENVSVAT